MDFGNIFMEIMSTNINTNHMICWNRTLDGIAYIAIAVPIASTWTYNIYNIILITLIGHVVKWWFQINP